KPWQGGDIPIKLPKDDVPIAGRILDLQGKPLAGVKVRVRGVQWPTESNSRSTEDKGDLSDFIKALKTRKEAYYPHNELVTGLKSFSGGWALDDIYPPARTDAAGRFRIHGIGRERVADLLIEGPAIETKYVFAMTRASETIEVPAQDPKLT